ncbi:hypothetical protein ACIGO9_03380 [Nocardia asteroides]|uniref:hypothetical protein n=1 Tax=Nocardia asteroides TaxID=1824 RepID=UPI0037CA3837
MNHPEQHTAAESFGEILISSRSLDEYRAMFALTEDDLGRRILDCPSGAAEFTAEICGRGGDVTACDLAYANNGLERVAAGAVAQAERGNRYVRAHQDLYAWSFFAGPDEHLRQRSAAAARFAAHTEHDAGRYVAGRLPTLPFPDSDFELALSSHLLFSYAADLDYEFHLRAVLELTRVAREVRIFPLVPVGSDTRYPLLDMLLAELGEHDVLGRIVDVDYEFQKGGNEMLVCRRGAPAP